jgi:hypothetical protein
LPCGRSKALHAKSYLEEVRDLMRSIGEQVRVAYRPGATLEAAQAQVD